MDSNTERCALPLHMCTTIYRMHVTNRNPQSGYSSSTEIRTCETLLSLSGPIKVELGVVDCMCSISHQQC